MSFGLYMDVHIPGQITRALRSRGVDVITAQEDNAARYADADLLARAGKLGRLMFTMDEDFLVEAVRRMRAGEMFATVVYVHMRDFSIGSCVDDLVMLADLSSPEEGQGRIVYLPL